MKDAIAAADRRITGTARQSRQQATLPSRTIGEPKPRFDIVLIGSETVFDTFLDFARSAHIFVACAKIEREVRFYLPVILAVEIRFIDSILKEEWAVSFREGTHTAVEKSLV